MADESISGSLTNGKKQLISEIVIAAMAGAMLGCGGGHNSEQRVVTNVYVVGNGTNGSRGEIAEYWNNGTLTVLGAGVYPSAASSIFVSGTDVYVAGIEGNGNNGDTNFAKYWKNGVAVDVTDGTQTSWVNSIFVSGNDVYLAGAELGATTTIAEYWKDGVAVALTDGTEAAMAWSIYVSGTDVYVAGEETDPNTGYDVATYWLNGTPVELTGGSQDSLAFSILVSGSDVYVGGYYCTVFGNNCNVAAYWKNGSLVPLTELTNTTPTPCLSTGRTYTSPGIRLRAMVLRCIGITARSHS